MNFVDAFVEWIGPTETPPAFLRWSALSLLAAACGNRIALGYRRGHHDEAIPPNLYVLLVGPSGCGKSFAISRVKKILEKVQELDDNKTIEGDIPRQRIHTFQGHITHSGMYEALRTSRWVVDPKTKERRLVEMPWKGQFYLLQDELAQCLGGRELADMVVRALTGMYNGGDFQDATRTNGTVKLDDYCVNWLAGSNIDWLLDAISPNTMNAGFFRRTVIIMGEPSAQRLAPNIRHPRPAGWDTLFPALVGRVDELLDLEGTISLTNEAAQIDAQWYVQLEQPAREDHSLNTPTGRHDLALKLSLLLCLAEGDTIIRAEHMINAQEMVEEAVRWQQEIIPIIKKGSVGAPHDRILQQILSREGWISHARLARYAYEKCGVDARRLKEMIQTWLESGIVIENRKNGQLWYMAVK